MSLRRLLFLCVLVACAGSTFAQALSDVPVANDADTIYEVRVENNRRVEAEAVRRALKQRVGQPFNPAKTADDLRALWALKYFSDVQLLVQRTSKGVAYVVRVEEKPAIHSVTLSGNDELSKDDFKDVIDLKTYSILDLAAVKRNVKKIQDKYVEKGFFLAEVSYQLKPSESGREVNVVFAINEHAKVMVSDINFLGANKVNADELKAVMATQEGGFLSFLTSQGTYREEAFQRDQQIIQMAYFDRGFINVRLDKPTVTLTPDKRHISITIRIDEGESYRVGKLDFSGDLLVSKEELGKKMLSKEGETFNRSLMAKDIQAITDVYYDQGFAYANITPMTSVNAEARTIDLTFDVQKGRPVSIERIDLAGNTKTRDRVIRRQLRVFEGELFSGTGMRRSKEKVTALGYFETVEISHKPGSDAEHVVVTVEVKEKSTGTFQVGLGFSNVESFIFTAQVAQQNALGWGQAISASAQLSSLRQFFQLSYFDPYFLDTSLIMSADAYRTMLAYTNFTRTATGGTLGLGYYVMPDEMSVNVSYNLEAVSVEDPQVRPTSGINSVVRLSWTWDRRNNRLFPSKGWLSYASLETAPKFIGSSFNFMRYTAYQRAYVPLPFGAVFKLNLQAGYTQELDPNNHLPRSELYYLGGINTIRGYGLRSVSPMELQGSSGPGATPSGQLRLQAVGGDKQVVFNAELEFPILEKVGIRGVLFYDAGNAFARNKSFFQYTPDEQNKGLVLPLGLFHSVGFGVRWFSPVGPLRFEWGIPLTKRVQDQPILFEFNIGNSF